MKNKNTLAVLLMATTFLFSCKDDKATTPTEERIEANQPTEYETTQESSDTISVLKDSIVDENMKGQSDTHGKDTDAGR